MILPGELDVRPPIPGESLDGFVAEIAAENELVKVRRISGAGGVTHGHRPQLATTGWRDLPVLADLLNVPVEELRLRSYPFVGDDGSRRAFFGTTVHRTDLRIRERFFSPAALAISPYHRAMWQLKLPFDLETGELLVSRCPRPGCGKVQRWRHSAGVRYCDTCVEDLSAQATERLGEDLLPDYRLAAGLTHFDPGTRAASLELLPKEIRALGADMAYELLLRLVPVLEPRCAWRKGERLWGNDPSDVAHGMVAAWRTLRGWPDAVIATFTEQLATSTTRFSDGNGGRSVTFLRLRSGGYVAEPVAAAICALHAGIDEDGPEGGRLKSETLACQEAADLTGLSTAILVPLRRKRVLRTVAVARGPLLVPVFSRAEIAEVDRDIHRRWDLSRAGVVLGLPYYALEQLCALGRLERLPHPYFAARYPEPQITEATVEALSHLIRGAAASSLPGATSIISAMRMVGGRLKPWDAVVEAMLSGTLPFQVRDGKGALFERIRVRKDDLRGPASLPITRAGANTALTIRIPPDFPFVAHLTKRDAGEVLNLGVSQYTRLLRGYRTTSNRIVPVVDVLRIATGHVTNTEIAERSGIPYQRVRLKAAELGITRLSEAGYGRNLAERLMTAALTRSDR